MSTISKILLFVILLIVANLYIFRPGYWFYQDAGYWPKTIQEALKMLFVQLHTFTNDGYYLGVDQGLFNFTRIIIVLYSTLIFLLFGHGGSQIVFIFTGFILAFLSFYLFSGLFFKDKKIRFVLSLLYVFNPLSYALQGHVFYQAIAPLFIYAYHRFFYESRMLRWKYLLLVFFAMYLWVSYIRFLQSNFIVIISYIGYLFYVYKKHFPIKKIASFAIFFFLLFLPIIFSFTSQLLEGSQTAFNYGVVLGQFVVKYKMFDAFNLFQSAGVKVYDGILWSGIGIVFFSYIIYLLLTFPKQLRSGFYFLNLFLVIAGLTFYAMANIFGNSIYLYLLRIFPFITNEPFWGFYVLSMPLITLIGLITKDRIKNLYFFTFFYIIAGTIPFLNLSDFQLQKFHLSSMPRSYYESFVKPYDGIPEASFYFPQTCWRAIYMNEANTPTLCPNYGYHYPSIFTDNPRIISGTTYDLSQKFSKNIQTDNLRITHNLKHIFIPNDIVIKKGPGPDTGEDELQVIKDVKKTFDQKVTTTLQVNQNFNHYTYNDKDKYDFLIYSPKNILTFFSKDFLQQAIPLSSSPMVMEQVPSFLMKEKQAVHIDYKIAKDSPTKYFVKFSGITEMTPFLLQFNQAYLRSWKVKIISQKDYDMQECIGSNSSYSISDNARCQYKGNAFDIRDGRFLTYPSLGEKTHFIGNFLNNGWLIDPNEITPKKRNTGTVYAVIIYTKQIFYTYMILIAIVALVLLALFSIIQEGRMYQMRSKERNEKK